MSKARKTDAETPKGQAAAKTVERRQAIERLTADALEVARTLQTGDAPVIVCKLENLLRWVRRGAHEPSA